MRLDKFLKVSGIIKRRSVAQKIAELGGVLKDGRTLKPSHDVKVGDVLTIKQRHGTIMIRVTAIPTGNVKGDYFELLEQKKE
jgi:ribosomal 50S subunit-recycling heat shock protein